MPTPQSGYLGPMESDDSSEDETSDHEYMMQLRKKEVMVYHEICRVFRAQGRLTPDKLRLLREIAGALYIPEDRHRIECRMAANDQELCAIAKRVAGPYTAAEWIEEGTDPRPPSPPKTPSDSHVLKLCDKVRDAVQAAIRSRRPGQELVTAYYNPEWFQPGYCFSDEEDETDKNKNGENIKPADENKDDELSSLSEDSAEEDQKDEGVKKDASDKVLMPPPPPVETSAPVPKVSSPSVTLPVPVITVPSSSSIATATQPTFSGQTPHDTHSTSEVTLADSHTSETQEAPLLSETDDIEYLPPLVVVPPPEPPTTLVLPSGVTYQVRDANGDVKTRKRTLSQDGNTGGPSHKTVAFSNISKVTPQSQIKMTPVVSSASTPPRYPPTLTSSTTQKVIIVSNTSGGLPRSMSVPVGPIIRTSQSQQTISGLLQPPTPSTSGVVTKFRPRMLSVPTRCRGKTSPLVIPNLQLKNPITLRPDSVTVMDGRVSGPARILPKPPSGQMFIVNSGQGTTVGGQAVSSTGTKQNVVILQKGGGSQRALTLTNTSKEMMQKMITKKCVVIQSSKVVPKTITPKPAPPPVTTSASNVVVLDLSQEQYRHNLGSTTIADILQASGIITSAAPHGIQPVTDTTGISATDSNWMSVDKPDDLEEVTLPVCEPEPVITLDDSEEMLEDEPEPSTVVTDHSQMIQFSEDDCPDQIFTVTPDELSMLVSEPFTSDCGQIVVDTLTSEMAASHSFPPHRDGAVTIQHQNNDMPTNMSLEDYSSQQMENQGLN